jgi:hypothetical protein
LLDVLGEIPAGHALVHVLVPGQRVELLDPRLHVVPGDPLAGRDRLQVDLLQHPPVVLDHAVRDVDPELLLRPQDGKPQLPFEHDLVLRRPQLRHRQAGITRSENVRDPGLTGGRHVPHSLSRPPAASAGHLQTDTRRYRPGSAAVSGLLS